eukprot:COSAG02_NODE_3608_length_6488_cov_5.786508_3_plen_117_part_00
MRNHNVISKRRGSPFDFRGAFLNELTETDFCMKLLYRRWRQAARGAFLNELTETDFCMKLLYRRWRQAARGAFLNELTETDFCMKLLYRRWRQAARGAFLKLDEVSQAIEPSPQDY